MAKSTSIRPFLSNQMIFFVGKGGHESACIRGSKEFMKEFDEIKDLLQLKSRAELLEVIVNDFFIRLASLGVTPWPEVDDYLIETAKNEASAATQRLAGKLK